MLLHRYCYKSSTTLLNFSRRYCRFGKKKVKSAGKVYFTARCYESKQLADKVRWDVAAQAEP